MKRAIFLMTLSLFLAGTFLGLAGVLPGQGETAKKYALLVGINRYQHKKMPDLLYAVNDARKLGEVLAKAGFAVTILSDETGKDDPHQQPTKANIERHLQEVLEKCQRGDLVVVALAGHGLQFEKKDNDDKDDCYFCPQDARPFRDQVNTLVSLGQIYGQMERSFAGMKMLLVDACRDDPDATRGTRGGVTADRAPQPPQGVGALFSCCPGEKSFEIDKLQHGVFFYHVIKALEGEAVNRKQQVTFNTLADYVAEAVPDWVSTNIPGGKQFPNQKVNYSTAPVLIRNAAPMAETAKKEISKSVTETVKQEITNTIGMKLVYIPPDKFLMGSPQDEESRYDGEGPQHEVEITRGFYLGKYEVTQAQYRAVMGENPSWFSAAGGGEKRVARFDTDDFPVEMVSWEDAMGFCRKLSEKEEDLGRRYELPTEAQWEYACRAGSKTFFHFGNSLSSRQANFDGDGARWLFLGRPTRVGFYSPNAWGLHDMHGNVCEWCADWYDGGYYKDSPRQDPVNTKAASLRVIRGGSWYNPGWFCRSAYRLRAAPGSRIEHLGFRVAAVQSR